MAGREREESVHHHAVTPPRVVYSPHVFFDFNNDSLYDQPGEDKGPIGRWRYYVRDRLLSAMDWSAANQVPLFFGETNVPCTAGWAAVLDHAYRRFLEPFRFSAAAWHYIDPDHCPAISCELNLAACVSGVQLSVLERYPGGTYERLDPFKPLPSDSRLYADERVNPWDGGQGFFGDARVNFCAPDPLSGTGCTISVEFYQDNFAGMKFFHRNGIDTRRYRSLRFSILLTGAGQQNFKVFTTSPRSDCDPRDEDPVYPPFEARPSLMEILPSPQAGLWLQVEIPLARIVDPTEPIVNGIAFQNLEMRQDVFFLDDVTLVPLHPPSLFWRHQKSGDLVLFRMSGPHTLSTNLVGAVRDPLWKPKAVDDYDGDEERDVLWHHQGSGDVVLFRMVGAQIVSASLVATIADTRWQIQGSGDFNADGLADILWRHQASGDLFLFLMDGARISSSAFVASIPDLSWRVAGIGDYTGDGRSDVLWRNQQTGDVVLFKMDGLRLSGVSFLTRIADLKWSVRGSGDYDGNGTADMLWHHQTSGDLVMFLMKEGRIASVNFVTNVADTRWQPRVSDDYDGDGFSDILWHHELTGDVFLFLMEGATISSARSVGRIPDTDWQIVP